MNLAHHAALAAAAVGVAGAAAGAAITRALTTPAPRRFTTLAHANDDTVSLPRTDSTTTPGLYGLLLPDHTHIPVGEILDTDDRTVTRRIDRSHAASLASPTMTSWTGIRFAAPADASLRHHDFTIPSAGGPLPAWHIPGSTDTWTIHVHGLGSSRAGALRSAQVTARLGMPSLVVTYRGAIDDPHRDRATSMLGTTEYHDVVAAAQHAIDAGARRLVLVGWSMGALLCLAAAHDDRIRARVAALVLESAVLDWRATLAANLTRAGLPAAAATLAYPWLRVRPLARSLGLDDAIDLDELDWSRAARLEIPTLALHGLRDRSAPLEPVARLTDARPDLVTLATFDADHTMTWNRDPDLWRAGVTQWLVGTVG